MKTSIRTLWMASIFFCGCIPNPYEKPPQKQKTPFSGSISLMDMASPANSGGISYQAQITAQFTKSSRDLASLRRAQYQSVQCQLISSTEEGNKPNPTPPPQKISVGNLYLGTPTSATVIPITEKAAGVYESGLTAQFAPGLYLLKAEGKESVKPFMVEFSMPEELRGIKVNEHSLEEGPAVIQKSADLLIEFDPPTAPNDLNIMEVFIQTVQGKEQRLLVCGALESQLEKSNGKTQFKIPSAQLSGLLATPEGVFELVRVNAASGTLSSGPTLRLDGSRVWLWPGLVAE